MTASQNIEVRSVQPVSEPTLWSMLFNPANSLSTEPQRSSAPPNDTASMTRLIVHSWLSRPPFASAASTNSLPVTIEGP